MPSNFLNNSAVMMGVDFQMFFNVGPPPPTGTPIPMFPYFVGLPFYWPPATFWNRTGKVTADTWKMIDVDFSLLLIPHTPMGGVPGPAQAVNILKIVATSGSEASMGIGSVTGEGDPLAACLAGPVGINFNCWEFGDQPSGVVICVCSVQTTPSGMDWAMAALKWFAVGFLGEFMGKFLGKKLAKLLKKIPEAIWETVVKQIVINLVEQIAVQIRKIARALGH